MSTADMQIHFVEKNKCTCADIRAGVAALDYRCLEGGRNVHVVPFGTCSLTLELTAADICHATRRIVSLRYENARQRRQIGSLMP